jgi:hypothetical protein
VNVLILTARTGKAVSNQSSSADDQRDVQERFEVA